MEPVAAGALAGAALGGYSAWHGGGNAGQVVAGALLGGVSGFYGGLGMWGSSIASLELATLEWVSWFNHHRLLEPIGYIPPAEAEDNYYRQLSSQTTTVE